ncbi:ABC transporter permease [Nitrospira sp. Nam80]
MAGRVKFGVIVPSQLITISVFLSLFCIWYFVTRNGLIDPIFLPSPAKTFEGLGTLLTREFVLQYLLPSLARVATGFALSVLVAFPLGVLAGQMPLVAMVVQPVCGAARYLPVAALVPLCILWFGIHDGQKVAVIVVGVIFQLVLLIASNTASVPTEHVEAGLTLGLSRCQILFHIVIPWSMPAIWDDLRISAGWAWSYLVLAELVAGNRGIGYFIVQSQRFLDTDKAFAGIILIGILGFLTDLGFRYSAIRLFKWA